VTGCSGFLGGRVAKYFASSFKKYTVVAAARRPDRQVELEKNNCIVKLGNLLDKDYCEEITNNIDFVLHCAGLSSPWGDYGEFYKANVEVTKNILEASCSHGVRKFIFISTPSIYFNFKDRFLVKEADPLPESLVNNYASTKLIAENHVLDKNGNDILTLALRPRAIIGAEDTVIFPRLLRAYHAGKLRIVGRGDNRCDLTCAANVITAMECAISAGEAAFGRAYNITDGNPVNLWEMINTLLVGLELRPVTKGAPESLALMYARFVEMRHKVLRRSSEPELTCYGMGTLSKSLTLDISLATRYLGYSPVQTTAEGISEFIKWYQAKK